MDLSALLEPAEPRRARAGFVVFGAWTLITGIALALTPDPAGHGTHKQLGLSACPSAALFDRPCPGCGLTTSWTATVHGDLPTALKAHLLGPFAYLAFTALALVSLWAALRSRRIVTESAWFNRALAVFAVAFFGYSFWRFGTSGGYATPSESVIRSVIAR